MRAPSNLSGWKFTAEISDEALEAAGSGTEGRITFTVSINIFYCRFC